MLNPNERKLYLEALKPPPGYTLDKGIAATYSLDLLTLLVVPLSFVLFNYNGEEDLKDQTKVMEALQRTSERLTIYCQKGRISVPKVNSLLYSYLEKCVKEVNADGTFHPKTWLLRFTAEDERPMYRFICLSRNLTFDKSWDTLLVLDGENEAINQPENKPLIDYLKSLSAMAGSPDDKLQELVDELSRVKFTAPPGFEDSLKFHPLGIDNYTYNPLFEEADTMLLVSPFVSDRLLQQVIAKSRARCTLLSRMESLDALDEETLDLFERLFVIDDPVMEEADEESGQEQSRSDLHAKIFVIEQGDKARILTGSANATNSAFTINTEFMVEMIADKKTYGIDNLLRMEKNLFGTVIKEYQPQEKPDVDQERIALESKINDIHRKISACDFNVQVVKSETSGAYDLKVNAGDDIIDLEEDVEVTCWPITLKDERAQSINYINVVDLVFNELSPAAVTSFIAFEIMVHGKRQKMSSRFVFNLPLTGMPEERDEKILIRIISDRNRFLRYLLFLLAEEHSYQPGLLELIPRTEDAVISQDGDNTVDGLLLLEEMVRAFSRSPEKIDRIAHLVQGLLKSDEGREILPDDFIQIWEPIWKARQRMVNQK